MPLGSQRPSREPAENLQSQRTSEIVSDRDPDGGNFAISQTSQRECPAEKLTHNPSPLVEGKATRARTSL